MSLLSVCSLTPLKQLIEMNSNVEDDSPTNADGFRLINFRIQPNVHWKIEKTLTIQGTIPIF